MKDWCWADNLLYSISQSCCNVSHKKKNLFFFFSFYTAAGHYLLAAMEFFRWTGAAAVDERVVSIGKGGGVDEFFPGRSDKLIDSDRLIGCRALRARHWGPFYQERHIALAVPL